MMADFFDSKYEDNISTTNLPSTIKFFPDMSQFDEIDDETVEMPVVIPEWSLKKIGTLQSRLEQIQGQRSNSKGHFGAKNQISNFGSSLVFNIANEVFGFNGWSSHIVRCNKILEDFDESNSRFSAKFSVLIRVTLKDGTFNEDYGIGVASNMPFKYMCYSKCKKQAVTEATKNAILGFAHALLDYEIQRLEQNSLKNISN